VLFHPPPQAVVLIACHDFFPGVMVAVTVGREAQPNTAANPAEL